MITHEESDRLEVSPESLNEFLETFPHAQKNIEKMREEGILTVRGGLNDNS